MADLRHLLAIYVHAHQAGNSVPPHIDAEARAVLAAKPPAPAPAVDGEREAFAQWLDRRGAMADLGVRDSYFRAAALLRQPAPAPVSPPASKREEMYDDAWRLLSRRQRAEEVERLCTEAGIDLKSLDARRLVRDARDGMPLHDVRDLIKHCTPTPTPEPPND